MLTSVTTHSIRFTAMLLMLSGPVLAQPTDLNGRNGEARLSGELRYISDAVSVSSSGRNSAPRLSRGEADIYAVAECSSQAGRNAARTGDEPRAADCN